MILQIEKNRFIGDEKPLPTIYISDDNNRGCQFVAGFPNLQNNVIYYGNELGWSFTRKLRLFSKRTYEAHH